MMNLLELKNYLTNTIYGSDGKISTGKFKSLPIEVKDSILHFTIKYQSEKLSERIYWILNDLQDYPAKCKHPECDKPIRFKGEYRVCSAHIVVIQNISCQSCLTPSVDY